MEIAQNLLEYAMKRVVYLVEVMSLEEERLGH